MVVTLDQSYANAFSCRSENMKTYIMKKAYDINMISILYKELYTYNN